MKFIALIATLMVINNADAASNFLGLKGQSCELIENNFEITNDDVVNNKIILNFGNSSQVTCDADDFKIIDIRLTVENAHDFTKFTNVSEGLDLYGLRQYQLKRKFTSLLPVGEEEYMVILDKTVLKFFLFEGKVVGILSDWLDQYAVDYEREVSRSAEEYNRVPMNRFKRLLQNNLDSLGWIERNGQIYDQNSHWNVRSVVNVKISKNNCKIEYSTLSQNTGYQDDYVIDFTRGMGWVNPRTSSSVHRNSLMISVDILGSNPNGAYQGNLPGTYLNFDSSTSADEVTQTFREMHSACR